MNTVMYYYSATGNSLMIARAVAQALGNATVLPAARFRKDGTAPGAERVGIVFPIHAWGPPRTVVEFIRRLDLRGARYVFAIASCGGTAGDALVKVRHALRRNGGELHAGFIVRSPGYMASNGDESGMIKLVRRLSGEPFPADRERLPEIIEAVQSQRRAGPERNALLGSMLGSFFHRMAEKAFAGLDKNYRVMGECAQCATCCRVCPRGNVTLERGGPTWHHDCDFCGACATWCSRGIIGFGAAAMAGAEGKAIPRRHHPQVTAADLLWC